MPEDDITELARNAREFPLIGFAMEHHITGEHPQYADFSERTTTGEWLGRPMDSSSMDTRASIGYSPTRKMSPHYFTRESRSLRPADEIVKSPLTFTRKEELEIKTGYPGRFGGPSEEELDEIKDDPTLKEKLYGVEETYQRYESETVEVYLNDALDLPRGIAPESRQIAYSLSIPLDNEDSLRGVNGGTRPQGNTEVILVGPEEGIDITIDNMLRASEEDIGSGRVSGDVVEEFVRGLFPDWKVEDIPAHAFQGGAFDPDKPAYRQYKDWEQRNWSMENSEFFDSYVEENEKRGATRLLDQHGEFANSYSLEEI